MLRRLGDRRRDWEHGWGPQDDEPSIAAIHHALEHGINWIDTAVVLDQTYRMNGEEHRISAPTSIVFNRDNGGWKVAMIHTVPLPE